MQDFDKGNHRRLQRFRCGAWSTVARYLTGGSNPRSMNIYSATAMEGRANSRTDVNGGLALAHGTPYTETSARMSVVGLI
jgi:hypothetical protein